MLVFNPLAWVRGGVVDFTVQLPEAAPAIEIVDEAGRFLLRKARSTNAATHTFSVHALVPDVERMGYKLVFARPAMARSRNAPGVQVSADGHTLENQFLRVTVDPRLVASPAW